MPSRPSLHFGTSTSPRHQSNLVKEGLAAPPKTAASAHVEYYKSPSNTPRRPSFSMDSLLHPHRDKNKRSDSKDRESGGKEKRLSVSMRGSSQTKSKDKASPRLAPARAGKFDLVIESPPVCFYGGTSSSTGAIFSGRLKLTILDPTGNVKLTKLTMKLCASIVSKKPIQKDCIECKERTNTIKEWNFLTEPKIFKKSEDTELPFSHLIPGHLPATTSSTLGSISYYLHAIAITSTPDVIEFTHPLVFQRAVMPGSDRSSIRIFPPTNLTGRLVLPPVIHPIGSFPVQMQLSGVVEKKPDHELRWRLKKMMWRIEEHTKMVSVPCSKHGAKLGAGKGVQNEDSRALGNDELKSGWKTDFDTAGGEITMEFDASLSTKTSNRAVCDVDSPAGLEVKHNLVIELIVAEEFCPNKNRSLVTPTGAARVLRMQFSLTVTERAGMGISWDEEMPPVYEDVPDSPPGYGSADKNDGAFGGAIMEDYQGPELEYTDLERMPTSNPDDPPVYRIRDPAEIAQAGPSAGPSVPHQRRRYANSDEDLPLSPGAGAHPLGRWTADELDLEPPQYAVRNRHESEAGLQEDVGEGSAAPATS